ncbi:hypothetical protein KXV52_001456 [Aspergillus fumigatus]|nr:hypothetical protein KXV52_001456 [Aspergillus fumigatus]
MALHPFDPITPAEIQLAVKILEAAFPGVSLRYKKIDVNEPLKKEVVPYIEAERLGKALPAAPTRLLQVLFHRLDNGAFYKALLNAGTRSVVYAKQLPKEVQGPVDADELIEIEQLCLSHPAVQAEIAKMQLPQGVTVCNDPWIYGTDDPKETRRLFQCYMYVVTTDHPQNNHYSTPCKFSPVFDALTRELVRMDYLPGGVDTQVSETQPWKTVETIQYAHDLLTEPLRTDLKPYIVQQPEGPSFHVQGNLVSWQKWKFRVGFNTREGLVIYNTTYDGRNVFYRLSVSEMTVPYGDPRAPYHRKQAFDVGDVGFGITANQLSLGCDCLGYIKYFDGYRSDSKGNPVQLKNVICLHEQDNGLQHKHTNYRTGAATVVRNRQLVVQMICTVSNYEYIFAFIFDQAANIELEVRATGILSTVPFDNEKFGTTVPWGTNVGPGVMAPFHQHMFSFRIDPAIDGFKNTVYYEDSVPMPEDENNPYLVGYTTEQTVLRTSGSANTSVERHRVFKIRNDACINPITYKPVAYKLQTAPSQMLLAGNRSFGYKRAEFATKPIWVTKYQDDELFAAGEFTNQSKQSEGVEKWVQRNDPVENEDLVLWHTFGLTHNPRVEDFPVMPVERVSVMLKPDGFFTKNPALDVPASTQSFNRSTLHPEPAACCAPAKVKLRKDAVSYELICSGSTERRGRLIWAYLNEDISEDLLLECQLLLLSFATGIQDAATWPDYSCFASNQTGNTLFLAIGVAGLANNAYSFPNIGMSLGMFIAGGLLVGQLGNLFGVRRRLWLLLSSVIQTVLVVVGLIVQYTLPVKQEGPAALGVIACLAFSSGAQVAMSRSLKITEITTAMATAAYVDVVVDPGLLRVHNRPRTRRVLFLVMLTAGCFVGAFAQRAVNSSFALLWCAVGKAVVTVSLLWNKRLEKTC